MALRVAAVQLNSRDDKAANLAAAEELIAKAAEGGAELVVLPELWTYLGPEDGNHANADPLPGPTTERLSALARRHQIILHGGSLLERADRGDGRLYNTAILFDAQGRLIARYRKVHLFDAAPLDNAPPYRESATMAAGDAVVIAEVGALHLGLAVCYDVRFPALFGAMAQGGAEVVALPSAFTLETGRDHWEVLVRARAIETGCFIIAPDQYGAHPPARTTYGRSLIVDPWGVVLAQAPDGVGFIWADLDLDRVRQVRRRLPCLGQRRPEIYGS